MFHIVKRSYAHSTVNVKIHTDSNTFEIVKSLKDDVPNVAVAKILDRGYVATIVVTTTERQVFDINPPVEDRDK